MINTLDEYKLYILVSIGIISVGLLIYTFWGSPLGPFTRKSGGDNSTAPGGLDIEDHIPSPIPSLPSSGKD